MMSNTKVNRLIPFIIRNLTINLPNNQSNVRNYYTFLFNRYLILVSDMNYIRNLTTYSYINNDLRTMELQWN